MFLPPNATSRAQIDEIVRDVKAKHPTVRLGIHCHNDQGLAVANSLQAVRSGADVVQVRQSTTAAVSALFMVELFFRLQRCVQILPTSEWDVRAKTKNGVSRMGDPDVGLE